MGLSDLELKEWKNFSETDALHFAKEIERKIKQHITFLKLKKYTYCGHSFLQALFKADDSEFSLIPGGEIQIGYNAETFSPTKEQKESYQRSAARFKMKETISEFIQGTTIPVRKVSFKAFLIETHPIEIGLEKMNPNESEVKKLIKKYPGGVTVYKQLKIKKSEDGTLQAWCIISRTHDDVLSELAKNGYQLPTSDELEYICKGESTTLFRWGDFCPCDRYPTDNTKASVGKKREWVLSGN